MKKIHFFSFEIKKEIIYTWRNVILCHKSEEMAKLFGRNIGCQLLKNFYSVRCVYAIIRMDGFTLECLPFED